MIAKIAPALTTTRMVKGLKPLLLAVLPALVCACGSSTSTPGGARDRHEPRAAANAKTSANAPAPADQDMVAAVSQAGTQPPIGLKFRLDTRPVVGRPAQLVLELIPSPGLAISHIHGSLQPADGLQLQSERSFDFDAPQDGATLAQAVTVVPQHDGVLSLSAVLVVDYDSTSIARTFVIPLIASDNAS